MGLPPQTLLGDIVPKPLLRFAAVLTGLTCMYRVAIHEGCYLLTEILPRPLLRFALFQQSIRVRTISMDYAVIHEAGGSGTSGS